MFFHKIYLIEFSTFEKFTSFYDKPFFNWVSFHARLNSNYEKWICKKKKKKMKIIEESCLDRTQEKHVPVISRLKGHLDDRSKESVLQECNARV